METETMMRYIKKGPELLCVDPKYDHLTEGECMAILGAEAIFELNFPLTQGALVRVILHSAYLGVNFWRLQQLQNFFQLPLEVFIEAMEASGYQTARSKQGLVVMHIENPMIRHSDSNGFYAIIRVLQKHKEAYGKDAF